ncbi:hypothetical protein D3C84_760660 [compost metagenome]
MVSLGQIQHVVDQLRHPLQFFEVTVQGFAVVLDGAGAGEGDLGVGQQVRQWGAQFMGNVGRERGQALKRVVEASEHGIEVVGHFRQFRWHVFFRQPHVQRLRGNPAGDRTDAPQRAQAAARRPCPQQCGGQG